MSCKLAKHAYEKLIEENLEWLNAQPRTCEREHIAMIVKDSVRWYYPEREEPSGE